MANHYMEFHYNVILSLISKYKFLFSTEQVCLASLILFGLSAKEADTLSFPNNNVMSSLL